MQGIVPTLAQAEGIGAFLPLILIVVVFYFLLIRPQQRRAKQQRELVNSIEENDRVVTIGGLHGTVRQVDEDTIRLEVSPGTTVVCAKQAVSRRIFEDDDEDDE